jgi:hypothetical protein
MNNSTISPQETIAEILRLRPEWDRPGLVKQLRAASVNYPAEVVSLAARECARDRTMRTPGAISGRCELLIERERRAARDRGAAAPDRPGPLPAEHCQNPACACDHATCWAGWLYPNFDRPCAECRPALSARVAAAPTPRRPRPAISDDTRALIDATRRELTERRERRNTLEPKGKSA